jgi:hypothetical protein
MLHNIGGRYEVVLSEVESGGDAKPLGGTRHPANQKRELIPIHNDKKSEASPLLIRHRINPPSAFFGCHLHQRVAASDQRMGAIAAARGLRLKGTHRL